MAAGLRAPAIPGTSETEGCGWHMGCEILNAVSLRIPGFHLTEHERDRLATRKEEES